MDLDDYERRLDRFADELGEAEGAWEPYVSGLFTESADAEDCVILRQSMLTAQDITDCRPYLQIGYFPDPDEDRRLAWWAFTLELLDRSEARALARSCALYDPVQPLFVGAPNLFGHIRRRADGGAPDLELIDDRAIRCIDGSEVYQVGRGFAKLAPHLPPSIPSWARATYPHAPLFVRLDPARYHETQPLQTLVEAAIVPASPHWLQTLSLFAGEPTFAHYDLLGDLELEGVEAYREFKARGVRRLEVRAQRRDAGYLSMIIEELPDPDARNGLMVGRCIHLDTRAPIGTPMKEAKLQHLDLAINVYTGPDRASRMANTLQHGKSQDATYRTHLLRIEAVPFPVLFVIAEMFFKSRTLLREWRQDALRMGDDPPQPRIRTEIGQ